MQEKQKITEETENLCKKPDQNRSIYNMMRDRLILINRIFLLCVTVGSAICAMLIFASVSAQHPIWIGVFSASIFLVSIIPSTLNFDLRILEKQQLFSCGEDGFEMQKTF